MEAIFPLISSSVCGPLGISHLPRLWLKVLLHATGRLPEGYRHGTGGFDEMLLDALGIEPAAFIAYIERELPNYLALEAWVKAHAKHLDAETIHRHNRIVATRDQKEELAAEKRTALGLNEPELRHAITLNDLDDWLGAHAQIVQQYSRSGAP